MSAADDKRFSQATDNLISLYRNVERRTLDLPFLDVMPLIISTWASLKFFFLFLVDLFLIIPNLVILVRNLFPGHHWRYRSFSLPYLKYIWLWIWRGEAPALPFILIRPLLGVFVRIHFGNRLQRLRREIALRDGLSDATRSALRGRIDGALELWKSPRITGIFSTVLWPVVYYFPPWWEQMTKSLGINFPTGLIQNLFALINSDIFGWIVFGYLVFIPVTACLAKRGLFLAMDPGRLCFPGEEAGSGIYLKEREILDSVGIHARETPIDLVVLLLTWMMGDSVDLLNLKSEEMGGFIFREAISFGLLAFVYLRRRKGDRA
jgi:hypothetical protein